MRPYLPILATLIYLAFAGWLVWVVFGVLGAVQLDIRGAFDGGCEPIERIGS